MTLIVDAQGGIHALYSEVIDFASLGSVSIRRASHVEPDDHGQWWADLSPVKGPTLGPFALRSACARCRASLARSPLASGRGIMNRRHVISTKEAFS